MAFSVAQLMNDNRLQAPVKLYDEIENEKIFSSWCEDINLENKSVVRRSKRIPGPSHEVSSNTGIHRIKKFLLIVYHLTKVSRDFMQACKGTRPCKL